MTYLYYTTYQKKRKNIPPIRKNIPPIQKNEEDYHLFKSMKRLSRCTDEEFLAVLTHTHLERILRYLARYLYLSIGFSKSNSNPLC